MSPQRALGGLNSRSSSNAMLRTPQVAKTTVPSTPCRKQQSSLRQRCPPICFKQDDKDVKTATEGVRDYKVGKEMPSWSAGLVEVSRTDLKKILEKLPETVTGSKPEGGLGNKKASSKDKDDLASLPGMYLADTVSVTADFPPPLDLGNYIPHPDIPRAHKAVSKEVPEGSPETPNNRTVMQQHIMFWDRDNDGIIWPQDTFIGFRRLGFGYLISTMAVPFIHGSFSWPSGERWLPEWGFPIYVDRVHRAKHGSDSETYDTEGRYVPTKFESIFTKFDKENKGGLSWADIQVMIKHNANVNDTVGWIAARFEWWMTYLLLRDENGILQKEMVRRMYDGTIWEMVAAQVEEKRNAKRLRA